MSYSLVLQGNQTGLTFNVVIVNDSGQFWNTNSSSFESFNSAHWSQYAVNLPEVAGTGIYRTTYPSGIALGTVTTEFIYQQSSGSPTLPSQAGGDVPSGSINSQGQLILKQQLLIQNDAALSNFEFLMVSSTDHITPATGLTVAAQRSINGGAFASCANSVSEIGSGIYAINLAASDLNGTVITLKFTATGADATYCTIVTQN